MRCNRRPERSVRDVLISVLAGSFKSIHDDIGARDFYPLRDDVIDQPVVSTKRWIKLARGLNFQVDRKTVAHEFRY